MNFLFHIIMIFVFQASSLFCCADEEIKGSKKDKKWVRRDLSFHINPASENALKRCVAALEQLEQTTFFTIQMNAYNKSFEKVFHPILHGCFENQKGILEKAFDTTCETGSLLLNGELEKAWESLKRCNGAVATLKTAIGGAVGYYAGQQAERVLFHSQFYNTEEGSDCSGNASLNALQQAERDVEMKIPNWKTTMCPNGVVNCPRIGAYSKKILTGMQLFFKNINEYEKKRKLDYFSKDDCIRIFNFLGDVKTIICATNLMSALTSKSGSISSDEPLKNYEKVMNYLVALPTDMHNPLSDWKKNSVEIEDSLSFLPISQKRDMYRYMRKLLKRAQNPRYGHQDGDSSINLLFSGPTGTGKTFLGKKLPPLLGFKPIIIKLAELQEGQNRSVNAISDLVTCDIPLSGLEKKLLCLNDIKTKGIIPCNPICFIDELDEDRNHTISELKDQFDQFKRIYLPSLGIEIPGFLNCIFTTNNENLLKDPALISRFVQISFPKMTVDKKIGILNKMLKKKLEQEYWHLKSHKHEIKGLLKQLVEYNDSINIRILIDNIDSVIDFVEMDRIIKSKEAFLFPPEDHDSKTRETYEEFLEHQFKDLKLDKNASDYENSDQSSWGASSSSSFS